MCIFRVPVPQEGTANATISIKDLKPNMKNIKIVFIILEVGEYPD